MLRRKIEHIKLTPEELTQRYLLAGLPKGLADLLVFLESETAKGSEEKLRGNAVHDLTGKPPQSLEDWIEKNKRIWE